MFATIRIKTYSYGYWIKAKGLRKILHLLDDDFSSCEEFAFRIVVSEGMRTDLVGITHRWLTD